LALRRCEVAERPQNWLRQATSDLSHARHSVDVADYDWAAFACHQAAEKAVKALFQKLHLDAVPRDQIADVQLVDETPAALPAIAKFREFTLPEGTRLAVRLDSAVGSDSSRVEDPIEATLTDAVVVDGTEVLAAGSVVRAEVAAVQSAGKVKGRASLALLFGSVSVPGRDERYPIAARADRMAPATKGEDVAKIAIPAAAGVIIGGLIGGKKGVAIGTAIGGGAGAAVVLSTAGPQTRLPRGTVLSLPLDQAVDVRVPINKS